LAPSLMEMLEIRRRYAKPRESSPNTLSTALKKPCPGRA
jgi:hypothetical protein